MARRGGHPHIIQWILGQN